MPNFSGIWTVTQQMQAKGASTWPAVPGAPTIGTATNAGPTSISVAFTAPACAGYPATITGYLATSTPGCITGTAVSSPITVSGLTTGTAYTFKVKAQNATGYGPCSAASNSATPAVVVGQQAYTTAGTYSWVAPSGVTAVSVVVVGGGGGGESSAGSYNGGGGGGLRYGNNISVTPSSSYTVVVGARGNGSSSGTPGLSTSGGNSSFNASVIANGGSSGTTRTGGSGSGGTGGATGGTGGTGASGVRFGGGAGAAGYSGNGGDGGTSGNGTSGAGGGGGGGWACCDRGSGGGVGILGQGSSGAGGTSASPSGKGGSGGCNGGGSGGIYGGGGGGELAGAVGAARIIWPGTSRSFPSTCTGNL